MVKYSNGWWAKVIVLVTVFLVIGYFFVVALFSFSQITNDITSAVSKVTSESNAELDACRQEVVLWRKDMNSILQYQSLSMESWQNNDVDKAIDFYTNASELYMSIVSPTCDADVMLIHSHTGKELLLVGKSFQAALIGDDESAISYINQASEHLQQRKELFKVINQRYNFN